MLMDILSGGLSFEALVPGILASLIVIFLTLPIHEFAHGFVANKLGDPTARYQGRLTLNPMAHIDYLGALCILLVGFGWAKPVPINSYYFKKPKRDIALTALAGPVSNLIMALVVTLLRNILIVLVGRRSVAMEYVLPTLVYISIINISLAVFNLIPVPPLDGSRILFAFLPDKYYYKLMRYEQYFIWVIFIILVSGFLDYPLSVIQIFFWDIINSIASLPFRFF